MATSYQHQPTVFNLTHPRSRKAKRKKKKHKLGLGGGLGTALNIVEDVAIGVGAVALLAAPFVAPETLPFIASVEAGAVTSLTAVKVAKDVRSSPGDFGAQATVAAKKQVTSRLQDSVARGHTSDSANVGNTTGAGLRFKDRHYYQKNPVWRGYDHIGNNIYRASAKIINGPFDVIEPAERAAAARKKLKKPIENIVGNFGSSNLIIVGERGYPDGVIWGAGLLIDRPMKEKRPKGYDWSIRQARSPFLG